MYLTLALQLVLYTFATKSTKQQNHNTFCHNSKTQWATLCKKASPFVMLKVLSRILPAFSFSSHHSVLSPAIDVKAICLVLQRFILSRSSYRATWPHHPPISPHSALVRGLFTSQTTSFLFRFPIKHMGAR